MSKLIAFLLFALSPALLFAVDGQILINQAAVMAAGGFPYAITQPGSYKLSGNLVVPAGSDGIHILVSNVTLDLNGFSITTASSAMGTYGVVSKPSTGVEPAAITIRNGAVRGFDYPVSNGTTNLTLGTSWTLENLTMTRDLPGKFGSIGVGAYSRVEHIIAQDSYIFVVCPAVVAFTVSLNAFSETDSPYPSATCTFTGNSH